MTSWPFGRHEVVDAVRPPTLRLVVDCCFPVFGLCGVNRVVEIAPKFDGHLFLR